MGVAVAMFILNPIHWRFAGIGVVASLSLLMNRWIAERTREGFRKQQAALGALNGQIEETINGQRVVKAYGREDRAVADFDKANGALVDAAKSAQTYAGFVGPVMNMVNNTGSSSPWWPRSWRLPRATRSVDGRHDCHLHQLHTRQFGARPLNDIANLYNTIQSALAGAERVFEIIR